MRHQNEPWTTSQVQGLNIVKTSNQILSGITSPRTWECQNIKWTTGFLTLKVTSLNKSSHHYTMPLSLVRRHGLYYIPKWRQMPFGLNHCVDQTSWSNNEQENHYWNVWSSRLRTMQHSSQLSQKLNDMLRLTWQRKQLSMGCGLNHISDAQKAQRNSKVIAENKYWRLFSNTDNPMEECS